jgi:hypothetical protein
MLELERFAMLLLSIYLLDSPVNEHLWPQGDHLAEKVGCAEMNRAGLRSHDSKFSMVNHSGTWAQIVVV